MPFDILNDMGIESIPVSTVMTRNVITEADDQNIQAVCKIMNESNIGSVIIVKGSIGTTYEITKSNVPNPSDMSNPLS
jgi:predicted transcriptional regulator